MSQDANAPAAPAANNPNNDTIVHVYDETLLEADNALPNWWLGILFGTMAFGIAYWGYYHILETPGTYATYDSQMQAEAARQAAATPVTNESLDQLSHDSAAVADGRATFMANCVACHGPSAGGIIGPNLTDNAWLHGGHPVDIYKTVNEGYPAKGMLAWGPPLGVAKVRNVVAYVLTLRNTNVAGGKPPQGDVMP